MSAKFDAWRSLWQPKTRYLTLMILIMTMMVLGPILEEYVAIRIIIDVFLTAIILAMLSTVGLKKRLARFGILLAVVMLILLWLKHFANYEMISAVSMVIGAVFTTIVTAYTIAFIMNSKTVTREVVYAAMLVYLLLAQLWALVYTFLYLIEPTSFLLPRGQGDFLVFEYYSFVTLTTLGFGDITPLTKIAKAFSVLEAVVGQLYLVVVVAWFVGMHVSRRSGNSS